MLQDLKLAGRTLRKHFRFTLIAVLTLALGIGATSAVFSVVNAVLLRPLTGYDTGRLVRIGLAWEEDRSGTPSPSVETYREWVNQSSVFEHIAANQFCFLNLTSPGEPEQINGPCTTANWFAVHRARAMIGRTFLPGEDTAGREHVIVLEHSFWLRRFGGDRAAVGRTVTLNRQSYEVIGVMPPDYQPLGKGNASFFIPYVLDHHPETGVLVTARLKQDVSVETARAEMAVIFDRLARANPQEYANRRLHVTPLLEERVGPHRKLLVLLFGSVALVLLIAAANVASLSLSRGISRQRELSIRTALGAGRWRLISPLLAESTLIGFGGCLAGLAVASLGLRLLTWRLASLPRIDEVSVDWMVALFSAGAALAAVLIFGMAPAVAVSRLNPELALRSANSCLSVGRRSRRMRTALVTVQIALAFMLLTGAGLLIRSFRLLREVDLGYEPRNVLTGFLALPEPADGSRTRGMAVYRRLRERIEALPGVRAAALSSQLPMGGVIIAMHVTPQGIDPEASRPGEPQAQVAIVSGRYFETVRIPLRSGRGFNDDDREGGTPVVIVSESVANRYFPGGALHQRVLIPEIKFNITGSGERWIACEIVGVVGDVLGTSISNGGVLHLYLPESQNAIRFTYLAVRTDRDQVSLVTAVKRAVYSEVPDLPVADLRSLENRAAFLTDPPRQGMWLLSVFSALALVLASIGVYGIMTSAVAQRRRELGIRSALGATPGQMVRLIAGEGFRLMAAGFLLGTAGALALTRTLEHLLYGVARTDALAFASAALALIFAAMLAGIGPAKASASVDPVTVLRAE